MMRREVKARDILDEIHHSPRFFFGEILGERPPERHGPYDKQIEIAEAVRDHRRVAVVGCQSSGKDWVAGRIILWWLLARRPAKAIILGPTHQQVASIVWKETRLAYFQAKIPLGGTMLQTPRWDIDDETFALGFATDQPFNIQGFHSPNLFICVTEAHAVEQEQFEAIKRLNPSRLLLTGNPLATQGEFYDAFHLNAELYHGIHVAARDTPNIKAGRVVIPGMLTLEDMEERKVEWGEGSAYYKASILGEFPDNLEDFLLSRSQVDAAVVLGLVAGEPHILSVDVGRGGDKTVILRRDGGVAALLLSRRTLDTMEIVGRAKKILDECPEFEGRITVDDTGIGGGVTDRLRELGVRVNAFVAGERARDEKRFANAQAEAWGLMADAVRKGGIKIPKDSALIAQLSTRAYKIQSDRRIILESKEALRAKGGRSPDEADALAMSFSPVAAQRMKVWV